MERFMIEVSRNGLAVSGYDAVKKALMSGNVLKILVSEGLELRKTTYRCTKEGTEFTFLERDDETHTKHECGGNLDRVSQIDAVEELLDIADKNKIEMVFVSDDSQYGKQLLMGFGGIAAMLKYKG